MMRSMVSVEAEPLGSVIDTLRRERARLMRNLLCIETALASLTGSTTGSTGEGGLVRGGR